MSFGKDPRNLTGVVPFGGSLTQRDRFHKAQAATAKASRGQGGGAPHWKDTLKLPYDHSRLGRLIPGQYHQKFTVDDETVQEQVQEYLIYREHWHGQSKRTSVCSAGPLYRSKKYAEPCIGCKIFWEDVVARAEKKKRGDSSKGPNRMSLHEVYAFTFYDYGLWLKLPQINDSNVVQVNPNTQQPYYDWTAVPANDPRAQQYEHKWGNLIAWTMSATHKEVLFTYNDNAIRNDCASCGSQGTITCRAKVCGNQMCRHPIYDPNNTSLTPQQRAELDSKPYSCPVCGQAAFIEEVIDCRMCAQWNVTPRRATLFDIDLEVMAVRSGDGKQTTLSILNRSSPRPIQVSDPKVLETIKPLDLATKFKPTPIDRQSAMWGIPVSILGGAPSPTTQQGLPPMGHAQFGGPQHQPYGGAPPHAQATTPPNFQPPAYYGPPPMQSPAQGHQYTPPGYSPMYPAPAPQQPQAPAPAPGQYVPFDYGKIPF